MSGEPNSRTLIFARNHTMYRSENIFSDGIHAQYLNGLFFFYSSNSSSSCYVRPLSLLTGLDRLLYVCTSRTTTWQIFFHLYALLCVDNFAPMFVILRRVGTFNGTLFRENTKRRMKIERNE